MKEIKPIKSYINAQVFEEHPDGASLVYEECITVKAYNQWFDEHIKGKYVIDPKECVRVYGSVHVNSDAEIWYPFAGKKNTHQAWLFGIEEIEEDSPEIERLAELEHEQWMKWASSIMETENISEGRKSRWEKCMVPYSELPEEMKEHDRVWARLAKKLLESK